MTTNQSSRKALLTLILSFVLSLKEVNAFSLIQKTTTTTALFASKKPKVFIDGEAGTTGLQVRDRLESRDDLEIISPPSELRKDEATRKEFLNKADAAILCLPDAASEEAASWIEENNDRTILIDASTAFRVDENWTYGLPELSKEQREKLATSKRISNPGCYPTGFITLMRPLVDAGMVKKGTPLTVNAVSGYTGGGKQLMAIFEDEETKCEPWGAYAFTMQHKHIPEMTKYSGLGRAPIFQPQVAAFSQGMVVHIPIHYEWFESESNVGVGEKVHSLLKEHYKDSKFVTVQPLDQKGCVEAGLFERDAFLRPDTLANTNKLELFVFSNDEAEQLVLVARLDNLGKGASGAAVQNLNIALGLDETAGL